MTTQTFPHKTAAARAWGADRGIAGKTGGYLYATDQATYAALPQMLRVGRPEQRAKLALVAGTPTGGTKAVQGWDSLADWLIRRNAIGTVRVNGRTRWAVLDIAPLAPVVEPEPADERASAADVWEQAWAEHITRYPAPDEYVARDRAATAEHAEGRTTNIALAAQRWAAPRGVTMRNGGFFRAEPDAYAALPAGLRAHTGDVRTPDGQRRAARKGLLWNGTVRAGHCIQGWVDLGRVLVTLGEIRVDRDGNRDHYTPVPVPPPDRAAGMIDLDALVTS